jgi:hypothetical protein
VHAFALALLSLTSPSIADQPPPKLQGGQMGLHGSIYGQSGIGVATGTAAGLGLGLLYRGDTLGVDAQARAALIGDDKHSVMGLSAQVGPRLYLGRGTVAPYVGAGLSVSVFHAGTPTLDVDSAGPGAYGVVGVELFRTSRVGLGASVQVDAPFYWLTGEEKNAVTGRWADVQRWVAPVAFNIDMVFR